MKIRLTLLTFLLPLLALGQQNTQYGTLTTTPTAYKQGTGLTSRMADYSSGIWYPKLYLQDTTSLLYTQYYINHNFAPITGGAYITTSTTQTTLSGNKKTTGNWQINKVTSADSANTAFLYVVGTSISNHTLVTDFFLPDSGYVQKLADKLGMYVINNGKSGTSLQQVTSGDNSGYTKRFQVPAYRANSLYIIELQANDAAILDSTVYKSSIWNTQANAMIDAAVAVGWPTNHILLGNMAYYNPSTGLSYNNIKARHDQYSAVMSSVAAARGTLVYDGYYTFTRTKLNADSLHPSNAGNTEISQNLFTYLSTHGITPISRGNYSSVVNGSQAITGNLNVTNNQYIYRNLFVNGTTKTQLLSFGGQLDNNSPLIYTTGSGSTVNIDSTGTVLMLMHMGGSTNTRFGGIVMNAQSPFNYTANTQSFFRMMESFAPTSGNAIWNNMLINPIINQTGGASGATYGIHIQPTTTSATDWRSIQLDNTVGYGVQQSSTSAINGFAGKTKFGSVATPVFTVDINGTIGATGAVTLSNYTTAFGVPYFSTIGGLVAETAQGAANTVLHGNGASAPSFSSIATGDIANNAVTYGKMQAMTTNKLLGSGASGTAVGEITLGSGLSYSGSTLNTVNNGTVTSITPGYGFTSGTPITTSGTMTIDTAVIQKKISNYITTNTNQTSLTGDKTSTGVWTVGKLVSTGQIYSSGGFIGLGSAAWTPTSFINTGYYQGNDYVKVSGALPYLQLVDGVTTNYWTVKNDYSISETPGFKLSFNYNGAQVATIRSNGSPKYSTDLIPKSYADSTYAKVNPLSSGTPTIVVNSNAGTGGSASIVGNNIDGVVTISVTGVAESNGIMATITFGGSGSYATKATPVLTLESSSTGVAAGTNLIYTSGTTNTWTIGISPTSLVTAGVFKFNYHVGGY